MRAEKQLLLDEIKDKIEASSAFVVTRYEKLDAKSTYNFRSTVFKAGGDFEVVRKRVLIKAAEAAGIKLDLDVLKGHVGVVFATKDAVEAVKMVCQYGTDNDNVVQVLGARVDGVLYQAADAERLSKLPSLNEMRAQVLALLEAPMAQTLAVMEALLASVMHCLENKRIQDQEQSST